MLFRSWSEASEEVSHWFDAPGPWIIEGVAVPRALRKWRARNPGLPPPADRLILLTKVHRDLPPGAIKMGKGMDTVMEELCGWLARSSLIIEKP